MYRMNFKQVKKVIEHMNKLHTQQDTKAWIERQGSIKWMIQRADEMRAGREAREKIAPVPEFREIP